MPFVPSTRSVLFVLASFLGLLAASLVAPLPAVNAQSAESADAPSLNGHWTGVIRLPGQELEFDLDFEVTDGAWSGDISIPLQGAKDLPLERVQLDGDRATFTITGIPGDPTFQGTIAPLAPVGVDGPGSGDSAGEGGAARGAAGLLELSGEFTQGGQSFPFEARNGEDPVDAAKAALEGLGAVIEAALADWRTPGVGVAVVMGDEVIHLSGYGLRDVEQNLPVTPRTLFAVGSTTKAFTTFTLATLVDEGRLDWDTPLIEYIPDFKLVDEYATLHLTPRDMVTHRSGLPRHDLVWYNDETVTRRELVHRLRYLEPNKELREAWQYNNLMFLTAGYLTEVLTGGSWEDALRERVLTPLGMTRTNFSVLDSQNSDDVSQPYVLDDDVVRKVDFRPLSVMGPAGSLNSSAEEMARWVRVHLSGGTFEGQVLLSAGTLRELHTPQMAIPGLPTDPELSPMSYAFGWFVEGWNGHLVVQHGGNIDGFSARVTLFPNDDLGVVVLSNRNGDALPGLLTYEIANRIFQEDDKDRLGDAAKERDEFQEFAKEGEEQQDMFRVRGTKPSRPLALYAGEYFHPGYGTAEVRFEEKSLVLVHNGMRMPLEHWHYDVFTVPEQRDEMIPAHLRVVFEENAEGRVSGFTVPFEPAVDPIFFEKLPDRKLHDPGFLAHLVGEYELPGDQVFSVHLQGDTLVGQVSDQPAVELIPQALDPDGAEFTIEEVKGVSFRFVLEKNEAVSKIFLVQPGGVFELPRHESE